MSETQKVNIEQRYCPTCYKQFEGLETCPQDGTVLRGPSNDPLIGKVFADRYDIESVLGLGGMSIVYKAKHRLMNRTVAIKMLHNKLKEDVVSLERFRLEAQAASTLSHQNIITVYDFGVTNDGELFFVMDFLHGESLENLIERKGRVPYERALPIFKQICAGLSAAHKKGIVHRDLKPANIVLTKEDDGSETVKIVDFGIAKMLVGGNQQHLTQTGEVFGSPIYMSPEQCLGKDLDIRSDIYSLGCLMYDTLAGGPPFRGESVLETMNMHCKDEPPSLNRAEGGATVPPELEEVIFKCMAKDPKDRFQNAAEIQDILGAISTTLLGNSGRYSSPSGASPTLRTTAATLGTTAVAPAVHHQNKALMAISTLLTAVLLGGLAFITLWPGPDEDRGSILNKMLWQFTVSMAEGDIKSKNFASAESKLNWAEDTARNFGDGKSRLEATLKLKSALYDSWEGHAEQLEKVNSALSALQTEEIRRELAARMKMLSSFDDKSSSPVQQTSDKLNGAAQIPAIILTAKNLYGAGMYGEEEDLLRKALAVERKLLGDDLVAIAQLEAQLADCLVARRKYAEVRALLAHAVAVHEKSDAESPEDYVLALNRLGQFDLDQSNMKDAEAELSKGLQQARELDSKKGAGSHKRVLLLCMRSYGDLLRQTKRQEEARKLLQEADALEKGGVGH
mgnify:CR=1 FL=1